MTNKRVFEDAEKMWGSVGVGSVFSSESTPGVYYLLSGLRRNYGARAMEFNEIKRGSVTKSVISDAALEGRGWFPLTLEWDNTPFVPIAVGDRYYHGMPLRVHLKKRHDKQTGAPMLSDGVL